MIYLQGQAMGRVSDEESEKMQAGWEARNKAQERASATFHIINAHGTVADLEAMAKALKPIAIGILERTA
jgi:hypothetical protein